MPNVLAQSRRSLRRSRLEGIRIATRSITRERVRNRTAVLRVLSEYGLSTEWISDQYRQVYRRLARQEIIVYRLSMALMFLLLGSVVVFWFALSFYFAEPGAVFVTVLLGMVGYLVVSIPSLVPWLLFRRSSAVNKFQLVYVGGLLAVSGLIIYGEVEGVGPVHAVVGDLVEDNTLIYALAAGVLTYGFMMVFAVLVIPIALFVCRGLLFAHPVDKALRILFRSIALAQSEELFLRLGTRHVLVAQLNQLSLIIRRGLWKALRPPSVLARSELRYRCTLAGEALNMLGVWVTLPARTTHKDFLARICALTDALLSGRWDELPTEPQPGAMSFRSRLAQVLDFGRTLLIGVAPLAILHTLQLFDISPPGGMDIALQGIFWTWFVVALIGALSELSNGRVQLREFLDLITQIRGGK